MNETLQQFCQRILPVVQAGAEGKEIEFLSKLTDEWQTKIAGGFDSIHEYRIAKPKATPLPITPEMWAMIDPAFNKVVLDENGFVWVTSLDVKWIDGEINFKGAGGDRLSSLLCGLPLTIDTTGIVPELSLTERPRIVSYADCIIDGGCDVHGADVHVNNAGEVKGGYIDPNLTRKELDRLCEERAAKVALDGWIHGVKTALMDATRKPLPKLDGRDRVTTTHMNPITGVVQVITTIK